MTKSIRSVSVAVGAVVAMTSACASRSVAGRVEGGIGDDICALMLKIEAHVTDTDGAGVSSAQVWLLSEPHLVPPEPMRAELLGVTDSEGRLIAPDCYMGSSAFALWRPENDPVRLALMITRQGFGVERVELRPPTADVLAAGNLLEVPPGQPLDLSKLHADPNWRQRGYVLPVRVTLVPIRK